MPGLQGLQDVKHSCRAIEPRLSSSKQARRSTALYEDWRPTVMLQAR